MNGKSKLGVIRTGFDNKVDFNLIIWISNLSTFTWWRLSLKTNIYIYVFISRKFLSCLGTFACNGQNLLSAHFKIENSINDSIDRAIANYSFSAVL
jgi:hypothetical protein